MMVVKPNARILDATAGNRTMWKTKESPLIFWIDKEEGLEIPPDTVMDCTKMDFSDKLFSMVFFDPPHGWGKKTGGSFTAIRNLKDYYNYKWLKEEQKTPRNNVTYYGWDKYQTKTQLLGFIHKAQKEFLRVLRDDGVLFLKWNECSLSLSKILPFFKDWIEMMRIPVHAPRQQWGKTRTYWIMFMKNQSLATTARKEE